MVAGPEGRVVDKICGNRGHGRKIGHMSYALGALGAEDCKLDGQCWQNCYNAAPVKGNASHEACVYQCRVGPGCPGGSAAPSSSSSKLLLIGGGVLVLGAVAFFVLRK